MWHVGTSWHGVQLYLMILILLLIYLLDNKNLYWGKETKKNLGWNFCSIYKLFYYIFYRFEDL